MNQHEPTPIDIETLPELDTAIGMAGTMQRAEVGGQVCLETGVFIVSALI